MFSAIIIINYYLANCGKTFTDFMYSCTISPCKELDTHYYPHIYLSIPPPPTRMHTRTVAGACFLCNECPSVAEEEEEGEDCTGRSRSEGSAACVESTAYALLALLRIGETQYVPCLAQWLVKVRSASGGFRSSQVSRVIHAHTQN